MERKSFLAVVAIATLAKLILAFTTYGTNDVSFYEGYAARAAQPHAIRLYEETIVFTRADGRPHHEPFWHPPFLLTLLPALLAAAKTSGLPFPFLFRLPSILADIGSCLLLWELQRRGTWAGPWWTPHLFAACPVLMLLSGFHGNTDPVMLFLLLLAVFLIETQRPAWAAGLAYGMSLSIKMWPAVLGPVFLLYLRRSKDRALFTAAGGAMFVLAGMPYLAQDPVYVIRHVLSYRSLFGQWGIGQILVSLPAPTLGDWFQTYGPIGVMLLCLAVAVAAHARARAPLLPRVGLVTAAFLAFTPGFGIQYLAWLVPWLPALGGYHLLLYSIGTGFFQFLVYHFWAKGFPWYLADSTMAGPWRDSLILPEIICWLLVLYLGWQFALAMGARLETAPVKRGKRR